MNTTDNRDAFYASVRAIDALCPACKQPQNAPSCEQRKHTPAQPKPACSICFTYCGGDCMRAQRFASPQTEHDPRLYAQCAEEEYRKP